MAFGPFQRHWKTIRLTDTNGDDSNDGDHFFKTRLDFMRSVVICDPNFTRDPSRKEDTLFSYFCAICAVLTGDSMRVRECTKKYFRFGFDIWFIFESVLKVATLLMTHDTINWIDRNKKPIPERKTFFFSVLFLELNSKIER